MIAMDETAVYMGQNTQQTEDFQGATLIYVPSTGYESSRITCILAIRLDGKKTPPFLITKGKKDKVEYMSGIYVLETEKAWSTQSALRKWLDVMLPLVLRGNQRGLLIWDSASTHRAKDMKNFLAERRVDQVMIPAGITAYIQALDIAINKPFKDYLRKETNDYIEKRMKRNQNNNFVKPGLQEVVSWVKNAWSKVTDSCISNALKAGYLDKNSPFEDSYIAKHERLGPLVLKELESELLVDQIHDIDLDGNYDIPEDDDLVVID